MARTVSALCVHKQSVYHDLENVECYDQSRDVRTFTGGTPIVAHPPCRAWSAFCSHQAKPPDGEKELAPLCVEWLRSCGGVLEHPAHSRLWDEMDLPKPGEYPRGGFVAIAVRQAWWGMNQQKSTWLLLSGVNPNDLEIPFRLYIPSGDKRRWQVKSKAQRSATPRQFAEWLVSAARISQIKKE